MPTNRTPIRRASKGSISPEAVELFKLCVEIEDDGLADTPESDGGRKEEYDSAQMELLRLLKWRPWEFSPLRISGDWPPDYVIRDGEQRVAEWRKAAAVKRELERAVAV